MVNRGSTLLVALFFLADVLNPIDRCMQWWPLPGFGERSDAATVPVGGLQDSCEAEPSLRVAAPAGFD